MIRPLKEIRTDEAPKAIGPYSQAVLSGDLLFVSGQIAVDASTSRLEGRGVREQTGRVIGNIEAVLRAYSIGLNRVVKTTVYLTDLEAFPEMNEVYENRFRGEPSSLLKFTPFWHAS